MQEVVGLMKNLSVHMMGGGRGQGYGYRRGYGSNEGFAGGRGRGMAGRGDMFQCYNCSEWGHKSPQCDKPKRMGGDMFPLPSQIPSRAQDYGIEIKGEAGPSGLTAEEKGKTKVVNIIRLDKGKDDINAIVMPVGKRTTREQETSDAGPSHKRGKQAETGIGKEKKKRKPRRHYNTSDFPLGEGQPNYNLRADLVGRKADVTFGQLMEMCPRLKRQWKRMVNPMKNEPTKGSVRVLSLNELPDICPTIDAWHKRKCIGEAYIDGGILSIYALTTAAERSWYWDQIVDVLPSVDSWIVGGDFNNVETFEDWRAAQLLALPHIARSAVVVITGVSGGLGRALALELAQRGYTLVGCGRSEEKLLDLEKTLSGGSKHLLKKVDVTSDSSVKEFAQTTLETKGAPAIVINFAGVINRNGKIWELSAAEFDAVMDVNVKGVANVMRHFLPLMAKQGMFVNITSGWGRIGAADVAPYCASKWAIEGLTQAVAKEVPQGVTVVALNPGVINTDMLVSCFGPQAALYQSPDTWAPIAADAILNLTAADNGASLNV
ncbi:hypothetical protein L7F22_024582 [Adiantum nelumboides]|nr:hypothetical protein [Adiantum nelumboides]